MVFVKEAGLPGTEVLLPCGKCIGCRLAKSREWAIRCVHEAKLYSDNCFLTLTYSTENLTFVNGLPTLNKRDFTLFMKRFRKMFGSGIRYFQCGEYGENFDRPHHHAIIFNFDFADKVLFSTKNNVSLYVSESLSCLWPYGFSTIGSVTFDSAAYVARYTMKKVNGDKADEHYNGRVPEYVTMSRRPGIGKEFYNKYSKDFYRYDRCVVLGQSLLKPPKYYDRLFELENPDRLRELKRERQACSPNLDPQLDYERLDVLNESANLRVNRFKRDYTE